MGMQEKILGEVTGKMKNSLENSTQQLQREFDKIVENQNQQMLALVTIYNAIKKIAVAQKVKLDEPLINMDIEEE
jgi:uncharacterized protein YfbU (UPF0304 family)